MELEFDKEIDAILRRNGRGVLEGDKPPEKHLDADAIAAFVENAIPDKMRRLYTEHFADCDRCRKLLSNSILMNQTAASMAAVGAAEVVAAPVAEAAAPWYKALFRTPNLAMAMGALVLTFSAVLGYLVLQNRNAEVNVSQATEPEMQKGGPYLGIEAPAANANAAAAANAATLNANSAGVPSSTPAEPMSANKPLAGPNTGETKALDGLVSKPDAEKEIATDAPAPEKPKPVAAAPPPPADDKTQPGAVAGAVRTEDAKDEDAALAKRKSAETRRDMPASPAKSGPVRSAGPVQNQSNQTNQRVFDMPVTRLVGGKTFDNRDGAWYDRAYRNQPTTNFRRGTDPYKKLDSGLRSIADNLGGTVVLVWKDKAYRIH